MEYSVSNAFSPTNGLVLQIAIVCHMHRHNTVRTHRETGTETAADHNAACPSLQHKLKATARQDRLNYNSSSV